MSEPDGIEWPREIWMAERDDHDQGVVWAVLSEHATVARFDGDKERDREFHRYVDGDIFDSQAKYYAAERDRLRAEVGRLREAAQEWAEARESTVSGEKATWERLANAESALAEAVRATSPACQTGSATDTTCEEEEMDVEVVAGKAVYFTYRNYRGEIANRCATPISLRWGTTKWHPEPGWLMLASDHDKGADREFALVDCDFRSTTDEAQG